MMLDAGETRSFRDAFRGRVNTEHDRIYANIRTNIRRQLPQVQIHAANDYRVAMLCGGPSLADNERRIRTLHHRHGWKIATVNGTHRWAMDRGLSPSVHAMLDARPFNARFVEDVERTCRYLICSQCDPAVFEALAGLDVHIWHGASRKEPEAKILDRFYAGRWQDVMGGGSIGTRAIGLLYLIGVRNVRVFGMDGCLRDGEHHAFAQSENDAGPHAIKGVRVRRRRFRAHVWMLAQLDDWLQMAPHVPEDLNLSIEGDGMLAYIIRETARTGRAPKITVEG
jgi:hypothetical protein